MLATCLKACIPVPAEALSLPGARGFVRGCCGRRVCRLWRRWARDSLASSWSFLGPAHWVCLTPHLHCCSHLAWLRWEIPVPVSPSPPSNTWEPCQPTWASNCCGVHYLLSIMYLNLAQEVFCDLGQVSASVFPSIKWRPSLLAC